MDLEESPFAVLGVAPLSSQNEIARAAEDAILDGRHSEADVRKAQQRLTVARPRLEAEAAWPIGADSTRLRQGLDAIARSPSELPPIWHELSGLSKANLAAHVCAKLVMAGLPVRRNPTAQTAINALFEAESKASPAKLAEDVNAVRLRAGFPPVKLDMAADALKAARAAHAKSLVALMATDPRPGLAMNEVVKRFLGDDGCADFLEMAVEHWDRWSMPTLAELERHIQVHLAQVEKSASADTALASLRLDIALWDELNQPRQEVFAKKGLDEPKALAIYASLRDLAVRLANDQERYDVSKVITEILKDHFQELPSVLKQMEEDAAALDKLVADAIKAATIKPFFEPISRVLEDPAPLTREIRQDGACKVVASGPVSKAIADGFAESMRLSAAMHPSEPFEFARRFSIWLHNEKEEIEAALWVAELALSHPTFSSLATPDDRKALAEGADIMRTTLALAWIVPAGRGGRHDEVIRLVTEALGVVRGDDNLRTLLAAEAAARNAARSAARRRKGRWIMAGVVGAIIGFIYLNDEGKRSSSPSSLSNSPPSPVQGTPANDAFQKAISGRPMWKVGAELMQEEYKWCVFEEARLATMAEMMPADGGSQALVDLYNAYIEGFNSICSSKTYRASWESPTASQKSANAMLFRADASARLNSGISLPADRPWPGTSLDVSRTLDAVLVQAALKRKAYYLGTVDGKFGPNSQAALAAFLRDVGRTASGGTLSEGIVTLLLGG